MAAGSRGRKKSRALTRDFQWKSPSSALLYACDQPARTAVDGFLEMPDFAERFRLAALLPDHPAEAYAHYVKIVLGGDVEHFRVECRHFRLLRRSPLGAEVGLDLAVHLR